MSDPDRDVVRHRRWMIRLYAITLFAITARMVTPLLLLAQVPIMQSLYGGSMEAAVEASIPTASGSAGSSTWPSPS